MDSDLVTVVVNVKVKDIRPMYDNLADWMHDPDHVYIGRKGIVFINGARFPKEDSIWANPFRIVGTETRSDVIHKYEKYITERLDRDPTLVEKLLSLKGKTLGCWCKPEPCHGDILVKLIAKWSTP